VVDETAMANTGRQMRVAQLVELGRVEVRSAPLPVPGASEARIRVSAVGLCGTDVKAFRRGHPYFPPPCVLGHEVVGIVDAVGREVRGLAEGGRVVCAPYVECGGCPTCLSGAGELCEHKSFIAGALQEYLILPREIAAQGTFLVPAGVSDNTATFAEPVACALNGIERAGVRHSDRILVVGGGPMGVLLALVARTLSSRVLVSEVRSARREHLRRLGLSVANPAETPMADALIAAFGAPEADRVLIAVGDRAVAEESVGWTAAGGTALLFGGLPKGDRLSLDAFAIHYREVTVAGSFGFQLRHFRDAVRWIEQHPHTLDGMVTTSMPLAEVARAFAEAERLDGLKTVIRFDDDT
jgi:L-iditol 2-dehydrogenase